MFLSLCLYHHDSLQSREVLTPRVHLLLEKLCFAWVFLVCFLCLYQTLFHPNLFIR